MPAQGPTGGRQLVGTEIRSRFYETLVVEHDTAPEPLCIREASRHDEHMTDIVRFDLFLLAPADALEVTIPFERRELGTSPQI